MHRAIAMPKIAGVPVYIVHLSSEDALNQVRRGPRPRRGPHSPKLAPQYLLLSVDELARPNFEGAKYVFTPPLRPKEHQPKLWDGLKHDHLQVVSTDHCPFCFEDQKVLGKDDFTKIPNGGPGIENRLQLIYHYGVNAGQLSLNRFVEITSTTPSRIFGMYPQKGELAAGSDADVVIWDPAALYTISAKTHHMRVDYSMFRRLPSAWQRAQSALARRSHRRWRRVSRQTGPRQIPQARRPRRSLEVGRAFRQSGENLRAHQIDRRHVERTPTRRRLQRLQPASTCGAETDSSRREPCGSTAPLEPPAMTARDPCLYTNPRAVVSLVVGISMALRGLVAPSVRCSYDCAWFAGSASQTEHDHPRPLSLQESARCRVPSGESLCQRYDGCTITLGLQISACPAPHSSR